MRRHGGGEGAAPAPVPRKHGPGRPWVTVRPHYGGPPFNGLDGRGRAGRKPRARACEAQAVRVPEDTVPRCKIAAVGGREATRPAQRARAPQGVGFETAPRGAPPPHLRGHGRKARPAPLKTFPGYDLPRLKIRDAVRSSRPRHADA